MPKKATTKRTQEVAVKSGTSSTREDEGVKSTGDWSNLPDLVLERVFTYLPRSDQASASLVCQNWSRAFDSPNIWRKIVVDVENATERSLWRILKFAKSDDKYLRILGEFKHLENLNVDYFYVSDEVLRLLAQNCGGSLRSLSIDSECMNEQQYPTIDNEVWRQFRKDCPNVLVDFRIMGINDLETLMLMVPSQVPLRRLKYRTSLSTDVDQHNMGPNKFITHVLTNCQHTLEDLSFKFDETIPMVDTVLLQFLPSLKKLTCLKVKAVISDTFVQEVEAMQERQEINHLSKFHAVKYDSDEGPAEVIRIFLL